MTLTTTTTTTTTRGRSSLNRDVHAARRGSSHKSPSSPAIIHYEPVDQQLATTEEELPTTHHALNETESGIPQEHKDTLSRRRRSSTSSIKKRNDYAGVWRRYPYYRIYFFSHLCQDAGDWFVRIASLLLVTELTADNQGTGLAHLVLANVLPKTIFAQVGGVLADNFDQRNVMIVLDVVSGIITAGFLYAIHFQSLPVLYLVTTLRAACGAMYYPVTTSMVRMLVGGGGAAAGSTTDHHHHDDHDDDSAAARSSSQQQQQQQDLLLANTMNSWTWASMAIVGGVVAGSLAAVIDLKACYLIDTLTFFISAALLTQIKGNYSVKHNHQDTVVLAIMTSQHDDHDSDEEAPPPSPLSSPSTSNHSHPPPHFDDSSSIMPVQPQQQHRRPCAALFAAAKEFGLYIFTCGFGVLTLLKATAALIWGAEDIISTAFAQAGTTTESGTCFRMGLTFSLIGAGSLLGPTAANHFTEGRGNNNSTADDSLASTTRKRLLVCLTGMGLQLLSWLGMWQAHNFETFLLFTFVRASGTSIVWVNSTVVLQTLSVKHQLGKVLAVEYLSYTLWEALAAYTAGSLEDDGVDKNQIALFAAGVAATAIVFWTYTIMRREQVQQQHTSSEWQSVETRETELVDTKNVKMFDDTTSVTTDDTETIATSATVDHKDDETLLVE